MKKTNTYVILNKDNFIKEIFAHDGYFVDQIPPCFSTKSLSKAFEDISFYNHITSTFGVTQIKAYPVEISVYKENILRRTLSFPNILAYIKLLGELQKSFDIYKNLISSENSESKAIMLTTLDYPSNYRNSIMNRNIKFSGNKYKLSIDIANCYPSIYSHSITWALLGKEKAKAMYINHQLQDNVYKKADKIDKINTKLKGSETNGLITGPYSSRIISEIILGAIDKILTSKGYEFSRYVDDYNFYFTSKYDCEKSLSDIACILSEFNLKINESKIKIEKYPFDILEDYSSIFQQSSSKQYPAYDILQKAAILDQQGKKGSYKYAFKLLRNKPDLMNRNSGQVFYLFYTLISIIINRPMMAKFAVEMISKLQVSFSENEMVDKLNDLLEKEIESNHDQEVLWLLYVILRYGSKIKQSNISKILTKSNDFAIMMILDLLKDHRKQIVGYETKQKSNINRLIKKDLKKLETELSCESLLTKRWFLIYEINYFKLNPYGLFKTLKVTNSTYTILKNNDVNFYKRIFKKISNYQKNS
jgi:hypothetical protein